jgi:hypothetical protein
LITYFIISLIFNIWFDFIFLLILFFIGKIYFYYIFLYIPDIVDSNFKIKVPILYKKKAFKFIDFENAYLIAKITDNGKQTVTFGIKKKGGKKIFEVDKIPCIHTIICEIEVQDFEEINKSSIERKELFKETLKIRSTEGLRIVHLTIDEKFFALCSWVQGIAESSLKSIFILEDISKYYNLTYKFSSFLLRNLSLINKEFIFEFISLIEKNKTDFSEVYIINSFQPILENIFHKKIKLTNKETVETIKEIIRIGYPVEHFFLFTYIFDYKKSLKSRIFTNKRHLNFFIKIMEEIEPRFEIYWIILEYIDITKFSLCKKYYKLIKEYDNKNRLNAKFITCGYIRKVKDNQDNLKTISQKMRKLVSKDFKKNHLIKIRT